MQTTAVAQLKATLSKYLLIVKSGEEVMVTERGKPIAKMIPVKRGEITTYMADMERAGIMKVGTGQIPPNFWDRPCPKDPKGRGRKALLQEREKGR